MQERGGVDGLKRKLYSRKEGMGHSEVRSGLSREESEVPKQWEGALPPRAPRPMLMQDATQHMAFATKFLMGAIVFFIVAVGGAALFFFTGGNYVSPDNIDLQIVAPALSDGGTVANFQFIIQNRNTAELKNVDLIIDYPDGTRDPKKPESLLTHERISIGVLTPGRQVKLTSSAILYGSEGATQPVRATLEYGIVGSNAVFTKESEATITIGSSPISVRVDAPQEAIAGEPFAFKVTVQSNATEPVEGVLIKAQYPFGFSVRSAAPKAEAGSTLWRLGTMAPGATQVINISGVLDGQDGDERVFRFAAGTNKDETAGGLSITFLSVPAALTVHRPFITGTISVDGKTGQKVSAAAGKILQGTVTWQNNLSDTLHDVQIKLRLDGVALNKTSIDAGSGFYSSGDSTITWTSAQDPTLAIVSPGATGVLHFSFMSYEPGAGGVVYTNPTIGLSLSVAAMRPGQGLVPEQVSSAANMEVTLASIAHVSAQALHFTGPFTNTGPMPPRADTPTTYTIQWTAKNSSNALAAASVTAVLPSYVTFVSAGQSSGVVYDAGSRTVRWNIGELKAGVGYSTSALSTSFQVSLTPSASQVGTAPALTGTARLVGTDRFAQTDVSATAEAPTTRLNEAGANGSMDIVLPKQ